MRNRTKQNENDQRIEEQLVALECRLIRELRQKLSNVQNISLAEPTDLLDMASDGEIDYMSALSAEAGSATVDEIELALQKLREGTYGICDTCGKRIAKRRLKARLFAVLCVRCKENEERHEYADRPSPVAARGDSELTVDLTDRDLEVPESSIEEVFRDAEISEIF